LASATSSATDLTGRDTGTTNTFCTTSNDEIGRKSLTGSYGDFVRNAAFTAIDDVP